mmetsp:Transcript_129816/g.229465  ORF Transcript_129816/g.229465 Transcript_129816/m.229465 type:complete len:81 (+) Transcript_129816:52-294(+)
MLITKLVYRGAANKSHKLQVNYICMVLSFLLAISGECGCCIAPQVNVELREAWQVPLRVDEYRGDHPEPACRNLRNMHLI